MDFRISSEQQLLRDTARRFVAEELPYETRKKHIAEGDDAWQAIADMGWFLLAVPESAGGLGGSLEDMAIVAEELGRGVALEPFIAGAVLPARLIALSGTARCEDLLADLASGKRRFAAALYEARHRYDLDSLDCFATARSDNGFAISGTKTLVLGGGVADWLIVAARTAADRHPALFIVSADAPGVTRRTYRTIDNLAVADVTFENVMLETDALLCSVEASAPVLAQALDEATTLLCADAVGCMDRAIEMTAEYLRIRQQFGQFLSSFQALQHGVANLFIEASDARSALYRAIAACAGKDVKQRERAVSACKVKVMEAARLVTGQAVHFHGGIGMTIEYPVGEHLRRSLVAEQIFGNGLHHLERYLASSESLNV
jgi:alkylation response protein AidB-like acyl-CoA dehydrogenase